MQVEFFHKRFEIFNVILHNIGSLWRPARVAVTAHVNRDHVIFSRELRRYVIELMGDAADAMQHYKWWFGFGTPVQIMQPYPVHLDEPVHIICRLESRRHWIGLGQAEPHTDQSAGDKPSSTLHLGRCYLSLILASS